MKFIGFLVSHLQGVLLQRVFENSQRICACLWQKTGDVLFSINQKPNKMNCWTFLISMHIESIQSEIFASLEENIPWRIFFIVIQSTSIQFEFVDEIDSSSIQLFIVLHSIWEKNNSEQTSFRTRFRRKSIKRVELIFFPILTEAWWRKEISRSFLRSTYKVEQDHYQVRCQWNI